MATTSLESPSPRSASASNHLAFRPLARPLWRTGFVLALLLMIPFWVRSWHQIDSRHFRFGPDGHVEICQAGSSLGLIVSVSGDPIIKFDGPIGPLDQEDRFPYEAKWPDGKSLGTAWNTCLFPPHHEELSKASLDRIGSLGAAMRWPDRFHLHLPYWFFALGILVIWLIFERRYFRG